MAASIVRHKTCGEPVTIAVYQHNVAVYIHCNHCNDMVEAGDLELVLSEPLEGEGMQSDQINGGLFI